MEYVLLALVLIEGGFITYLLIKTTKTVEPIKEEPIISELDRELKRQENIDKSFQKLFNYNEDIATRGYKE